MVDAIEYLERTIETQLDTDVLFVIHGRGTGALKNAVLEHLSHNHRVDVSNERSSHLFLGSTI